LEENLEVVIQGTDEDVCPDLGESPRLSCMEELRFGMDGCGPTSLIVW
jgi:hypothetical protein